MPEELAEVLAGQTNVASWKIHHIADETTTIFDDLFDDLLEELAGSNDFIRGAGWWVFCDDCKHNFSASPTVLTHIPARSILSTGQTMLVRRLRGGLVQGQSGPLKFSNIPSGFFSGNLT